MPNWLQTLLQFLAEWFVTVVKWWPWSTGVVKVFLVALVFSVPIVATDHLSVRVLADTNRELELGHFGMQLGIALAVAAVTVFAAVAFGVTWAKFFSLRIGDTVEDNNGWCQL